MSSVEEILQAVRNLALPERRYLIRTLNQAPELLDREDDTDKIQEERQQAALAEFIKMAGTLHSDFTDVSTNKKKYLAIAYADKR